MSQIPVWIIIIVVIIVLVLVVILASITTKSQPENPKHQNERVWNSGLFSESKDNNSSKSFDIIPIPLEKISDSWVFTINTLQPHQSYILGSTFTDSTISVYRTSFREPSVPRTSFPEDSEDLLLHSKLYSKNQGIVISGNLYNVNASNYQIGKHILLPNLKYNLIKIVEEDFQSSFKVVINNVGNNPLKVYQCNFIQSIQNQPFQSENYLKKNLSEKILGFSEYDIEKYISQTYNLKTRISGDAFLRNGDVWEFQGSGTYILVYVKNIYSFTVRNNNEVIVSEKNQKKILSELYSSDIQSIELKDPFLRIKNEDESIDITDINQNIVSFFQKPLQLYNRFVNGKEETVMDMWNQITNKIFVYKIE